MIASDKSGPYPDSDIEVLSEDDAKVTVLISFDVAETAVARLFQSMAGESLRAAYLEPADRGKYGRGVVVTFVPKVWLDHNEMEQNTGGVNDACMFCGSPGDWYDDGDGYCACSKCKGIADRVRGESEVASDE